MGSRNRSVLLPQNIDSCNNVLVIKCCPQKDASHFAKHIRQPDSDSELTESKTNKNLVDYTEHIE